MKTLRGYSVDIGIVYSSEKDKNGKQFRTAREIDFIASAGDKKLYIQSAYAMQTDEKKASETRSLALVKDAFPKIIVRHDVGKRWYDDMGILNVGIIDLLLSDII